MIISVKISYTVDDTHHTSIVLFLTVLSPTFFVSASNIELILWNINTGLIYKVDICEFIASVIKISDEKFAICYLSGKIDIRGLAEPDLIIYKVDFKLLFCETISSSQFLTCSMDSTITIMDSNLMKSLNRFSIFPQLALFNISLS